MSEDEFELDDLLDDVAKVPPAVEPTPQQTLPEPVPPGAVSYTHLTLPTILLV